MWFKQISFYPININQLPEADTLADKLNSSEFAPITGLDWFSEGFAAPHGFSPELLFPADFTWLVSLKRSDKVLPASVIREFLDEKVAEIQENENRKIGKKEKNELKEQITDDLLPRAFTRSSRLYALCDTRHGFLFVNHASANKAENMVVKLREALGGLEAKLPHTKQSPSALMTEWLAAGAAAGGFELDSDCELRGSGDVVSVVKVAKQDLTADEVTQHLKTGKTVSQMGLVWREQIAFILTADFTFKRIQYLDVLQEQAEQHGDDAPSMAFAEQILMAESLSQMILELVEHLGGWQED
ncbi:recombination-associated protein RdgC [Alysiella crassa]|uniref:Recombination-associated protein RdgC n=1 Tax=Alysiella crassa TaxID=153491 RepID=A0A376BUB9_9NEIS|nr:recombination-associated protein RdgC [Alysiella crassa]UOP06063.1 recombination-associated protein RdgC [Alysiella crassa]SSY80519.1 Recombination-associated protein rdgC [Alysiella crassa]